VTGSFLEARGSRQIVKGIQQTINLVGGASLKVDGIIGPLTFSAYRQLTAGGQKVVEALSAFYGFSMAGEYARYGARQVVAKVGETIPASASLLGASTKYPRGDVEDPRDNVVSANDMRSLRASLGRAGILDNRRQIRRTISAAGIPDSEAEALMAWIGVESGYTWDPRAREIGAAAGKGGFGFTMWTGSRARALVAYAKEKGLPASDFDVQLDFFREELADDPRSRAVILNKGTVWSTKSGFSPGLTGRNKVLRHMATLPTTREKVLAWQVYFYRPRTASLAKADVALRNYA